jgi:hypothetical protein
VVERNNASSITTLPKVFFIDFFSLVCKNYELSVSPVLLYHIQSIDFTGNFRIWNRFSQIGNLEEGRSRVLLIRALSGKYSRLTEVPFWSCPKGIFHFYCPAVLERTVPYCLEWISFYRIKKHARPSAEISGRMLA